MKCIQVFKVILSGICTPTGKLELLISRLTHSGPIQPAISITIIATINNYSGKFFSDKP